MSERNVASLPALGYKRVNEKLNVACVGCGAPGVSQFPAATKYLEWLVLGSMRFTNSAEANKYLQPFVRKGWEYKV